MPHKRARRHVSQWMVTLYQKKHNNMFLRTGPNQNIFINVFVLFVTKKKFTENFKNTYFLKLYLKKHFGHIRQNIHPKRFFR